MWKVSARRRLANLILAVLSSLLILAPAGMRAGERKTEQTASVDFSAEARLILVPVTVVDRQGTAVSDLRQEHFSIFDESEQRQIVSFTREDAPILLGIVLDLSGSMASKLPQALDAIRAVASAVGEVEQGFLITFADELQLHGDFTTNVRSLLDPSGLPVPQGGTALVDATYAALKKAHSARHPRTVLLVVSDGADNASVHSQSELLNFAKEADTQIYAISIHDRTPAKGERYGLYFMDDLAKATGGLHFQVKNSQGLPQVAARIAQAMTNVYVIGYKPPESISPAKWRKIRVALSSDAGKSLRVIARKGYGQK